MPSDRRPASTRRPVRRGGLLAEALETRRLLATIYVNTTVDDDGPAGRGTLSLRQAIEVSNGTLAVASLDPAQQKLVAGPLSTPNTIDFALPGAGPFVFAPSLDLPAITSPVVIDGYSQVGAHPNTHGPGKADNAVLLIELDRTNHLVPDPGVTGLDLKADGSTVRGLAIGGAEDAVGLHYAGASGAGILLEGAGDRVEGCFIGTRTDGLSPLPNEVGIAMTGPSPTIGGTADGSRNVIGFSIGTGLSIAGTGAVIEGNFVGVDVTGEGVISDGYYPHAAVEVGAGSSITIGGTATGAGNVISGTSEADGLLLSISSSNVLIEGNLIGLDVTGTRALGNVVGVVVGGLGVTIGGTALGAGNVISGNSQTGLIVYGQGDLVEGNLVGLDASGTRAIPNATDFGVGIEVSGDSNTVGGTALGAANVVAGNAGVGLLITGSRVLVEGNVVGLRALGNGGDGIDVSGGSVTIGGTALGAANIVSGNGGNGITIFNQFRFVPLIEGSVGDTPSVGYYALLPGGGQSDAIRGNSIFGNKGLRIDLLDNGGSFLESPGVGALSYYPTAVKPGDPPGANGLLPSPEIGSVVASAAGTEVSGTLDSTPSTTFAVDLYADPVNGSGQADLGAALATTDASGHASFGFGTGLDLRGLSVTATATDPEGDTSEFAADRFAVDRPSTTTTLFGPALLVALGRPITFVASVASTGSGVPAGLVAFAAEGVLLGVAALDASGVAVLTTSALPAGWHVIRAAYLGDAPDAPGLSGIVIVGVLPTVAQGGPTVTSLGSADLHSVKVTFSRALRVATAEDLGNYTLVGPAGRAVKVVSATYEPSDHSVTLETRQALKPGRVYRVTVNGRRIGRVDDVDGIPLAGKGGRPGTSFSGTVKTKAKAKGPAHGKRH